MCSSAGTTTAARRRFRGEVQPVRRSIRGLVTAPVAAAFDRSYPANERGGSIATRIDIDGLNTFVETRGSGEQTVVLLHGGLGNSDDLLDSIGLGLELRFRLVAFDRPGHGYTSDTDEPFHYDDMATHAIAVLERLDISPTPHLVGWSDGGIVALLVALRRPDLVDRLVLIGVNFHAEAVQLPESADEAAPPVLRERYAQRSPDGAGHFDVVEEKFMAMATAEPTLTVDDLARLGNPTLVLVGDDDAVDLGHTMALYEALPASRLCVVPGASHLVVIEQAQLVARVIDDFLTSTEPPKTMAPVRRAR